MSRTPDTVLLITRHFQTFCLTFPGKKLFRVNISLCECDGEISGKLCEIKEYLKKDVTLSVKVSQLRICVLLYFNKMI